MERAALQTFDIVAVVSERDRARLPRSGAQIVVCPNGWEPQPPLPPSRDPTVAFVALMGWRPNADAAVWLAREVWPLVLARAPVARLLLVGRDPTPAVQALAAPTVEVTGAVPDVRAYLARALVATAPLRAGGGSRLKIIEALGAARPVVATRVGAEGLEDLVGQGVVVADRPRELADALVDLLLDPAAAAALGQRGYAAVSERYSWSRTLQPLYELLDARAPA